MDSEVTEIGNGQANKLAFTKPIDLPQTVPDEEETAGPGVRWMLQVSLPDVGRRCRFPFSTKTKASRVASCFKKKHAEVLRLDRWPTREMLEKWKPFIDLNFEQIVEHLEGIRNAAKESGDSAPDGA